MPSLGLGLGLVAGSPALEPFIGPLDELSTGLLGAWGFQRLVSTYTGPLYTLVRDSDNAELEVSDPKLGPQQTFLAGSTGYVKRLYDQKNSNNLVQTTKARMPWLFYYGQPVTINGKMVAHYGRAGAFEDSIRLTAANNAALNPQSGHRLIYTVKRELAFTDTYLGHVDKDYDNDGYGFYSVPFDTYPNGLISRIDGNVVSAWPQQFEPGVHVIGQFFNPSLASGVRQQVYLDGVKKTEGFGPAAPLAGNAAAFMVGEVTAGYRMRGFIGDVLLYDNTAPAITTVSSTILNLYDDNGYYDIWCDGNSLTYGTGSTTSTGNNSGEYFVYGYPYVLRTTQPTDWRVHNVGVAGQGIDDMLADVQTEVLDNLDEGAIDRYVIFWEGTNVILNQAWTAQQTYDAYVDYAELVQAAGAKVIGMSVLPFATHVPSVGTHAALAAIVEDFNDLLRADHSFLDGFIDLALDERYDPTDLTVFQSDGVHLTDKGYAYVMVSVREKLVEMIG